MLAQLRICLPAIVLAVASLALSSCKLEYEKEDFSLKINPNGSAHLEVSYENFGSQETLSNLRRRDLDTLRDIAQNPEHAKKAAAAGVDFKNRRLDFVDFTINGYAEAEAKDYAKIFEVFTNYKLEVSDKIYITPLNGTVLRATLSGEGKIMIKNRRYVFAWPLDAKDISFKASYRTAGNRFVFDYEKQMEKTP